MVKSASGSPIPNAQIFVKNLASGVTFSVVTGGDDVVARQERARIRTLTGSSAITRVGAVRRAHSPDSWGAGPKGSSSFRTRHDESEWLALFKGAGNGRCTKNVAPYHSVPIGCSVWPATPSKYWPSGECFCFRLPHASAKVPLNLLPLLLRKPVFRPV